MVARGLYGAVAVGFLACGGEPTPPCDTTVIANVDLRSGTVAPGPRFDSAGALNVYELRQVAGETWASTGGGFRLVDDAGALSEPLSRSYFERFALGDVDADGDIDLVGFDGSTIRLFERTAELALVELGPIETLHSQVDGLLADVDNDGDLDILFSETGGPWVLLGDGAFGFQVTDQRGNRDDNVHWFGATDTDDDELVDFVVLSSPTGTTAGEPIELSTEVWLGLGDGMFAEPVSTPLGLPEVTSVGSRLVDVDQDTIADVALRVGRELLVAFGRGDGTFAPPATLSADLGHPGFAGQLIESADADDDGAPELVTVGDQAIAIVHYEPSGDARIDSIPLPSSQETEIEPITIATRVSMLASPIIRLALTEVVCPVQ